MSYYLVYLSFAIKKELQIYVKPDHVIQQKTIVFISRIIESFFIVFIVRIYSYCGPHCISPGDKTKGKLQWQRLILKDLRRFQDFRIIYNDGGSSNVQ